MNVFNFLTVAMHYCSWATSSAWWHDGMIGTLLCSRQRQRRRSHLISSWWQWEVPRERISLQSECCSWCVGVSHYGPTQDTSILREQSKNKISSIFWMIWFHISLPFIKYHQRAWQHQRLAGVVVSSTISEGVLQGPCEGIKIISLSHNFDWNFEFHSEEKDFSWRELSWDFFEWIWTQEDWD